MALSIADVNQRIVDVFGLHGLRVREFILRAVPNEPPTVTITRHMLDADEIKTATQVFSLGLCDPRPPTWEEWLEAEAIRLKVKIAKDFKEIAEFHDWRFRVEIEIAGLRSKEWDREVLRQSWLDELNGDVF